MDIQHIKIGETYLLPVTPTTIEKCGWLTVGTCNDYEYRIAPSEVKLLLQNGIKNTEPAPKYDPCRKFRKGDKVKAVLRHGRVPNNGVPKDVILKVIEDERDGVVKVLHKMGAFLEIFNVYALHLELVTPIEELEPYSVVDAHTHWDVADKDMKTVATYSKGNHPHAKAAAEAERDRLNAEHRKEKKNA